MCKENEKNLSLGNSFGQSIIVMKPNKKKRKKENDGFQGLEGGADTANI